MATLVDNVAIYAASIGNGAITLGSAVPGFRGREALTNGNTYSYSILQGAQFEYGRGQYLFTGSQFVRSPLSSSNGGTAITLQANAIVTFVALAEDITSGSSGGSYTPASGQFVA
jgi:hypothetical protein